MNQSQTPQKITKQLIKDIKTSKDIKEQSDRERLTAEEQKFCSLVAQGYTLTRAYRDSFPAKKHIGNDTVRRYSAELYAKSSIKSEVETKIETRARLARLAEDRIEEQLTDGKLGKVTADVSMFMYNHANGTPVNKVDVRSQSIQLNIDLTGNGTPQEL